jgi:hypothetical protein
VLDPQENRDLRVLLPVPRRRGATEAEDDHPGEVQARDGAAVGGGTE